MKRTWTEEELLEHFTLLPNELNAVGNKSGATRLGFVSFDLIRIIHNFGDNLFHRGVNYLNLNWKNVGVQQDKLILHQDCVRTGKSSGICNNFVRCAGLSKLTTFAIILYSSSSFLPL